jgi:hypothetical protein
LKTVQILNFAVQIEFDQPILSGYLRKKLNPMQITLIGFKDVPIKSEPKYKPVYGSVYFVDGS